MSAAHPTTSSTDIAAMLRQRALYLPDGLRFTAYDLNVGADEIDALTARLAVWEQLRPDIAACATHVREHCDRPYEAADRVTRTLKEQQP